MLAYGLPVPSLSVIVGQELKLAIEMILANLVALGLLGAASYNILYGGSMARVALYILGASVVLAIAKLICRSRKTRNRPCTVEESINDSSDGGVILKTMLPPFFASWR
jgi:hypothetical protein